jgi:biotin transport system substrate-specific component
MLYTLPQTRAAGLPLRIAGIAAFTAITALAARLTIETGGPVPFTLQVLPTLLAGLVLGWRDGALSQIAYVGLIALGLPLDARAIGAAALAGPTAGFLIGFIPAAAVAGAIAQIAGKSLWVRWMAGCYALFILYVIGVAWLALNAQISPSAAFNAVIAFIGFDVVKALLAAGLTETGRALLTNSAPQDH